MGTEVQTNKEFQEAIIERLRSDIGNLIPDDALKAMIEQAMQSMFFTRKVERSGYRDKELPSWFEEAVEQELNERIRSMAQAWFDVNQPMMEEIFAEMISSHAPKLMADALQVSFFNSGNQIGQSIGSCIEQGILHALQNRGF